MSEADEPMSERLTRLYGPLDESSRQPDPDWAALYSRPYSYFKEHEGKYALMHDKEVVELFANFKEAITAGRGQYATGDFTVQRLQTEPLDTGWPIAALTPQPR